MSDERTFESEDELRTWMLRLVNALCEEDDDTVEAVLADIPHSQSAVGMAMCLTAETLGVTTRLLARVPEGQTISARPVFTDDAEPSAITAGRITAAAIAGDSEMVHTMCRVVLEAGPAETGRVHGILIRALGQMLRRLESRRSEGSDR